MKSVVDQLAMYSCYHRDSRNVITHMVGIPLIVIALLALLSRPQWLIGAFYISPAMAIVAAGVIYYLMLDLVLGALMAIMLALTLWFSMWIAALSTPIWLALGIGLFVLGWVFQFVGHGYEGRKPAFVDDIMGLVIGPLFVVAELLFFVGIGKALYEKIENKVAVMLPNMPPANPNKLKS